MKTTDNEYSNLYNFALEMRKSYDELSITAGSKDKVFAIKDFNIVIDSDKRKISSRLYKPTEHPSSNLFPMVLFIHGGGWCSGNLETHDVLARALAVELGALVLAVDYRLAPEADALQQIDDVREAISWLYNNASELNGNKQKIIAIGDSAGGALVANIAHTLKDNSQIKIAAQWLMYPAVCLDTSTPSSLEYGEKYFPTNDVISMCWKSQLPEGFSKDDPRITPIFANHKNLSQTIISVAGLDPLTSSSQDYAKRLSDQGIKVELKYYENEEHGFIQFFKDNTNHPLGKKALDDGVKLLKQWLEF